MKQYEEEQEYQLHRRKFTSIIKLFKDQFSQTRWYLLGIQRLVSTHQFPANCHKFSYGGGCYSWQPQIQCPEQFLQVFI